MEQRPKVVRDIVLTSPVLHNMLATHQGGPDRAPTTADDKVALQNDQVPYMPCKNYMDPSREAKHQRDQLKDYFNHLGALSGQEDKIRDVIRNCLGDRRGGHLSVPFRTTQFYLS